MDSAGAKGGIRDLTGWRTAELSPKDAGFQGAFICKSFFILSVNKTGGGGVNFFFFLTAEINRTPQNEECDTNWTCGSTLSFIKNKYTLRTVNRAGKG